MDNTDVRKIVNDEIKKFVDDSLDKEIKKLLSKTSSQSREQVADIIKAAMESVYKMLWIKRDFWKTDIK